MDKRSYSNGMDIPLGLSMAMAQNPLAMSYFTALSPRQKQQLIGMAENVHSKEEMNRLVSSVAEDFPNDPNGAYAPFQDNSYHI